MLASMRIRLANTQATNSGGKNDFQILASQLDYKDSAKEIDIHCIGTQIGHYTLVVSAESEMRRP